MMKQTTQKPKNSRVRVLWRTALCVLCAVVCMIPLVTLASKDELNANDTKTEIGVYAQLVNRLVLPATTTDEDGNARVTLPDGTEVILQGGDPGKGRLVISPMEEPDALEWIAKVLGDRVKNPVAFHVYYWDESGEFHETTDVTVTIKRADAPDNAVLYSLNSGEKTQQLTLQNGDGTLQFVTNGAPYYVLGEKGATGSFTGGDAPQTGEQSHLWLGVTLTGSALVLLAAAAAGVRHRRRVR